MMDFNMLNNLLGTVTAYYETNREYLEQDEIASLIEQKKAIIDAMKNDSTWKENRFVNVTDEQYERMFKLIRNKKLSNQIIGIFNTMNELIDYMKSLGYKDEEILAQLFQYPNEFQYVDGVGLLRFFSLERI